MNRKWLTRLKRGTSLLELLIAASLTGIILSSVYVLWATMAKTWMSEGIKVELNQNLQLAISQIKKEMRLSSGSDIFFYPQGSLPYTAVSLPLAVDDDNDKFLELDASDNIIWDKTVVYHTFDLGGVIELRKTLFQPRDVNLDSTERVEQLSYVVSNGDGSGTHNGSNASTKVLFSNLDNFDITPGHA